MRTGLIAHSPPELLCARYVKLVSTLVAVTDADATAAPLASTTRPSRDAASFCAFRETEQNRAAIPKQQQRVLLVNGALLKPLMDVVQNIELRVPGLDALG